MACLIQFPLRALTAPIFPRPNNIAAAEEYANYPGNLGSPPLDTVPRDYSLDDSNPYAGVTRNPYAGRQGSYNNYPAASGQSTSQVVWQGPTDEALHGNDNEQQSQQQQPVIAHNYEYDQQQQIDAESPEARGVEGEEVGIREEQPVPDEQEAATNASTPRESEVNLRAPWEPLNVRRDRSVTPDPATLRNATLGAALGAPLSIAATDTDNAPQHRDNVVTSPTSIDLPPPPTDFGGLHAPTPRDGGFYTPSEGRSMTPAGGGESSYYDAQTSPPPPPAPILVPQPVPAASSFAPVPVGGKISAAAFRRGAKPRNSVDPEDSSSSQSPIRRLPIST